MPTTEHTLNDSLAEILRGTRNDWKNPNVVLSETSGTIKGSQEQPDILVLEPNVAPVVIETEVVPATTVEVEAKNRLGKRVRANGREILASVALRLPAKLRDYQGKKLSEEVLAATLEFALFTRGSSGEAKRWPERGWISGNYAELSLLIQSASLPPDLIEKASNRLIDGIGEAAGLMGEMEHENPNAIKRIAEELKQEDSVQTRRMASTIIANALIFHEALANGPGDLSEVLSFEQLRGLNNGLKKSEILREWRKILKVNYWPIFDISRRILELIPTKRSKHFVEGLIETAENLLENQLMQSHDISGAVFQRLIADRKFLAAYYTTPAAASFLAGLVFFNERLDSIDKWEDPEQIKALRIADFACGTGTLLSATYHKIGQLHELSGGDAGAIHPHFMSTSLVGCDVLPAATHLTASMLSGTHPTIVYSQSSIFTMGYGKQADGTIALGSLELLKPQGTFSILDITAKVVEGRGESEKQAWSELPHSSFDVVIMNPPFTRATGHEGSKIGIPNPMFAAFGSSSEEQREMGKATSKLTKGTSAHGNAGEASIFLVLADRKLKMRGTIALVMPLSLMTGKAWEESRKLLASKYKDLVIVSISGKSDGIMSFSADTGIGECLVIGTKSEESSERGTFVVLDKPPKSTLEGDTAAKVIHGLIADKKLKNLEDGPIGGTSLFFGEERIGEVLNAPLGENSGWNIARISDLSLAQVAHQLVNNNRVWLPGLSREDSIDLRISKVGDVGSIGPYHADISGKDSKGGIRGPFKIAKHESERIPTYPILWSHNAENERTIEFGGDSEGEVRTGRTRSEREEIKQKVEKIWSSASHCHFNRDFRFNSQSTAMQFTPRKTIGGRAWISIKLEKEDHEKALVLWANSTFGLLTHWWHANKQQPGRGSVGVLALSELPVLDVTKLASDNLSNVVAFFEEIKHQPLLPFHRIAEDPVRRQIDRFFCKEILLLDSPISEKDGPLDLLRKKLSAEPSIRGGKSGL